MNMQMIFTRPGPKMEYHAIIGDEHVATVLRRAGAWATYVPNGLGEFEFYTIHRVKAQAIWTIIDYIKRTRGRR